MAADLTPRIISTQHDQRYDRDTGAVRRIVRVEYKLGTFGPFVFEAAQDQFNEFTLRAEMDRNAATIRPFTV